MPYIVLPDNSLFELQNGETPEQAMALAERKYPAAFGHKPENGLVAQVKKGYETLKSEQGMGLRSLFGNPVEAAKQGIAQGEDINSRYGGSRGWQDVVEKYNDPNGGIMSALGEGAKFAGEQLANMSPTMAESMVTGRLGAMAGSAVAPGVGTLVGGGIGALTPWALQMLGSNVQQQQQQTPGSINVPAAAAAAIPQAAVGMAAHFIPLGRTMVGSMFGPAVKKALAAGDTAAAEALAKETLLQSAGKGVAYNAAVQVPAMVTQEALGRLQSGQSLTDADAQEAFGHAAFTGLALSPLGAAGRIGDASAMRGKLDLADRQAKAKAAADAQAAAADAQAADAAHKQTPEYLQELMQNYDNTLQQRDDLKAQMQALKDSVADTPNKERAAIHRQLNALKIESKTVETRLKPLADEYKSRSDDIAAMQEQQRVAGMSPEDVYMERTLGEVPKTSAAPQGAASAEEAAAQNLSAMQEPQVASAAPAGPDYVGAYLAKLQDPMAAAAGVNTMHPREAMEALLQRPDLGWQVLWKKRPSKPGADDGVRNTAPFPGTEDQPDNAASQMWKKELERQLGAELPESPQLPISAFQEGTEQVEQQDQDRLGNEIGTQREHLALQRRRQEENDRIAGMRQRQSSEDTAAVLRAEPDVRGTANVALSNAETAAKQGIASFAPKAAEAIQQGTLTPDAAGHLGIKGVDNDLQIADRATAQKLKPQVEERLKTIEQATQRASAFELTDDTGALNREGQAYQRLMAQATELRRIKAQIDQATQSRTFQKPGSVAQTIAADLQRGAPAAPEARLPSNVLDMTDAHIAALTGKTVKIEVQVGDTDKRATMHLDAAAAVRDIQKRHAGVEALLRCLA